ncbi:hypothetical protein NL676_004939 [Syzygium grande]|nr:hypothetical protein NL676_004939 [Syzygium grande]
MGKAKKMNLTSLLFKNHKETPRSNQPWPLQWPSCKHPKTLSFRAAGDDDQIFKTVNSVFLDSEMPESLFTTTSEEPEESASLSTESDAVIDVAEASVEVLVRGARSERLFFEPDDTSSILEEAKTVSFPFKESVVLAMESENPYVDFRRSMEEMVESHGLKDWECLEALLGWYLRVNGKKNHGFIVEAFVDLLMSLASDKSNGSASVTCYSSAASCFSASSPSCSLKGGNEIYEEDDGDDVLGKR